MRTIVQILFHKLRCDGYIAEFEIFDKVRVQYTIIRPNFPLTNDLRDKCDSYAI